MSFTENSHNVTGGVKAAIHNPNTSEASFVQASTHARSRANERLDDFDGGMEDSTDGNANPGGRTEDGKEVNHVIGGHKAALHNPNSSEEARNKARNVLEEHDVEM
ncbi:hypothetical protein CALCODRAFT_479533 [Calocera cornea HHB12733]|uniref:Conidiation protein 6 n=1 Tax=Calocera cornea HHB12733 TaxID=1353952 RepID=A0A165JMY5_9BASI|nr:hypothetical protein CALCODRAFT_479533 [Calocera cornea HHB12733]